MMQLSQRQIILITGALLAGFLLYYFSDIVTYLVIAWVISMLGRPLTVALQKRIRVGRIRMGASAASAITILLFYALLTGFMFLFVPTIVAQARNLASIDYYSIGEKLRGPFAELDLMLHQFGVLSANESLSVRIQHVFSEWFRPTLVGDYLGSVVSAAGNTMVTFASVTFILFFFLRDSSLFADIIHALVPDDMEKKVQAAIRSSSQVLTGYFRGLMIQTLIFAFNVTMILWIAGNKNSLLIGVFGGFFNIIPYVGPVLGMIFGLFITLSSNLDADFVLLLPMLLKVAGAFVVVQLIDNNLVGPYIISKSVQAHPLEIFLITLASAKLGGVTGMVVGVPVYTILRVIAREFFSNFKFVQRLTEQLNE
ncbi:MAG: AI-2E family transporter [Bacteroidota bacterium]